LDVPGEIGKGRKKCGPEVGFQKSLGDLRLGY
jgi:hypothetical protein